jgi:hypothetical protein
MEESDFDKGMNAGIVQERARCAGIVQLAREDLTDTDFRSIIHLIKGGTTVEEIRSWNQEQDE